MICASVLCLTVLACREERKEEVFYPDVPMFVRLFSSTSSEDEAPARLFFWEEESLDRVSTDGIPYYECELEKINEYGEEATKLQTGRYYPQLNTRVYAVGFVPSGLAPVAENSYGAYYLPYRNGEDTTVLASNSIVGSSVYIFRDLMEFRPATTQFIFRAIRTKNMENNLYVRNISVTMPYGAVPNLLRWDDAEVCYKAAYDRNLDRAEGGKGKVVDNPIEYKGNQLNTDTYSELGTRYLALPAEATSLTGITVTAQLSYKQDFPDEGESVTWYRQWPDKSNREEALEIPLLDMDKRPVTGIKPGESYLVTITFDQDAFAITAERQEWEQGGKIPIPIIPPQSAGK